MLRMKGVIAVAALAVLLQEVHCQPAQNVQLTNGPVGIAPHQQLSLEKPTFPVAIAQPAQPQLPSVAPTVTAPQPSVSAVPPATSPLTGQLPQGVAFPVTPPVAPTVLSTSFVLPPWIQRIANVAAGMTAFLSSIGIQDLPMVEDCGKAPQMREVMLCVQNIMDGARHIFNTGREIATLNVRVLSGGRRADSALARLKTLVSRPYSKKLMKALGSPMSALFLMQREATPDRQRWLAGSILTLVSDLPIATDIADSATGGFGHVNVVLPRPSRVHRIDRAMKELQQGMDPSAISNGGLGEGSVGDGGLFHDD
ncbi:hypothetical protein TGME49_262090 [Toxoplasma gondii ME49]|uniref:Transmembrane protein n=9 Tax=Toxoplasma gondii TaxID=5811 RepID=B9PLU0_TOXGV|nr:hypothetical protein TGME49_262090 [Toxoplasma gondii ME49]EPR62581.1 hypothetical protein TGGT1_262090 [Toxoplasma gondii GT1]ESS31962.1 hypothetical protein TGVEG_262090 [Toxoplasma gondii VEG]KAF4641066.1 hypothetical protein TGRH88_068750 [Toxoplasma gondii]KFG39465.1 hypothetical protein TGP89_262090 [Toxoplasma gondii p89]KFG49498.1 hypothetical protein TGDOM2_262090 [Toxoplasma gondii GAB2-2007-GAL-DOM2]KFG65456.1 hypothetical protein TGRUB_262090 [Toxoplasma gondii RUB]KYF40648.1 |eukprot:XP_002365331.1 hypothetical protein TGME49_262090 [Toxoplasma gondii ME49]